MTDPYIICEIFNNKPYINMDMAKKIINENTELKDQLQRANNLIVSMAAERTYTK